MIPTTMTMKTKKTYEQLGEELQEHFDIAIFLITPIITFLLAEMLHCSGLIALICCGIFQSLYTLHNLD